ncbi:tRNA lysidine(34) synthetase TilS [Mycoplasma hafezii]|uniref:tRNA lysidine(34) synthetase TilS n=1 Tax=Mycoplasma hafezii TaxID=525886 RepID=UPI003CFABFC8
MKINKNTTILLGVSGGPDSMYMLSKFNDYPNVNVAFVNYNQREDSKNDEKIVSDFCSQNNINLFKLCLNKEDYQKGNFQDWARQKRYEFFEEVSNKIGAEYLLLAHHLDDFLETAIMQKRSQRITSFYGIKKINKVNNLIIYRPFVNKYFKNTILRKCKKEGIPFYCDYTNELPKYTRNKIRIYFKKKTKLHKLIYIWYFKLKNLGLKNLQKKVDIEFKVWEQSGFSQELFKQMQYQKECVYKLVHSYFDDVELNSRKIVSIIQFITSTNRTSKYLLKNDVFLIKKQGKLIISK